MKKLITVIFSVIAAAVMCCTASAQCSDKVIDAADLLTDNQEQKLEASINELVDKYDVDFLVHTTDSLGGKDISDYARDKYSEQNCGIGDDSSGVILVIAMDTREARISRYGWAVQALTEYCNELNMDEITPYFTDEEYYNGCKTFLNNCDIFIEAAVNGEPYDENNRYRSAGDWMLMIGLSLLIGVVVALIACLSMKAMMKTAVPKPDANDYVRQNSFKLTKQRDVFVYSKTTRTERKDSSSGSGSISSDSEGTTGRF